MEQRDTSAAPSAAQIARQDAITLRDEGGASPVPAIQPALAEARPVGGVTASPYLPTESTFIDQSGISGDRSEEILENSALFSKALDGMRGDEATNVEAQELAQHHRRVLERAVGEQGIVNDLTCGLSLCMGSVTSRTTAEHEDWSGRLVKDPAARRYGAIHKYEAVGDQVQNRFVFSADPAIAALVLRQ
jgi:hypothetical protein